MPRVIDYQDDAACSLDECLSALERDGFNPLDEDSLMSAARWLRRLHNNRGFLADVMIDQLKDAVDGGSDVSAYGAQVITLSPMGRDHFMRANFWPGRGDHSFRASGNAAFSYELPHDHNFDFLTVGYFGPGYASDYYEYDYEAVDGAIGEKANLRFVERSTLDPGKLMHYRAHRDVHSQLPPESLSVSINIMHSSGAQGWLDQYRFDPEKDEISGIISAGGSEIFLRVAVGLDCPEAHDLAENFARTHVSERMRLVAMEAQAGALGIEERDALWRRAESNGSRLVAGEAKRRRAELELA
ncbi:transposase [Alteraurantiacibacter aquimixticola]|uniref:transposase n=1 Tax=Alteraurantiacibacter aquimixticola TaxID=2489173 RepID=UPI001B7D8672|nr:transposase [Alteraurantiacibacter aquimixticola]